MRSNAYAISNSAATTFALLIATNVNVNVTALSAQTDSYWASGASITFTVASGLTAGQSVVLRGNNLTGTSTAFIGFSAEL
jgi:hypothetical protein